MDISWPEGKQGTFHICTLIYTLVYQRKLISCKIFEHVHRYGAFVSVHLPSASAFTVLASASALMFSICVWSCCRCCPKVGGLAALLVVWARSSGSGTVPSTRLNTMLVSESVTCVGLATCWNMLCSSGQMYTWGSKVLSAWFVDPTGSKEGCLWRTSATSSRFMSSAPSGAVIWSIPSSRVILPNMELVDGSLSPADMTARKEWEHCQHEITGVLGMNPT